MSGVHGTTTSPKKTQTFAAPDQNQEELIRQRAYQLYVQRAREDGHDFDDWICRSDGSDSTTKTSCSLAVLAPALTPSVPHEWVKLDY